MATKEKDEVIDLEDVDISGFNEGTIILYNDDHNSFDYVIDCLMTILNYDYDAAVSMVILIDRTGKQAVRSGQYSKMRRDCELLVAAGLNAKVV